MNRYILAALYCAAVAGCVREGGNDYVNTAQAPASSSAKDTVRSTNADSSASSRTGSRLLPSPESLTDSVITAKIRASIVADPELRDADVSVNTTQGVVNLTGLVASQEQAARVSAHAQGQDGVMRVDSHLAVDFR